MDSKIKIVIGILIVGIILIGGWWIWKLGLEEESRMFPELSEGSLKEEILKNVQLVCDQNKLSEDECSKGLCGFNYMFEVISDEDVLEYKQQIENYKKDKYPSPEEIIHFFYKLVKSNHEDLDEKINEQCNK